MKKKLLIILAFMSSVVAWAHDVEIDGIYYNLDTTNKVATVTYRGNLSTTYTDEYQGDVVIPSSIIYNSVTYNVQSISSEAFLNCTALNSITIPSSVTSIGDDCFEDCTSLKKVDFKGDVEQWVDIYFSSNLSNPTYYAGDLYINGVLLTDAKIVSSNTIKKYVFLNCKSLKSLEIGSSVTSVIYPIFSSTSGIKSIVWNVKNMKDYSSSSYGNNMSPFYNLSSVTSFTFGPDVEHIPAYLCQRMENLQEVTVSSSVVSVGFGAFSSGIKKVNYLGDIEDWVNIDFASSSSNPTYYAEDLYIGGKLLKRVKIENSSTIKEYTFYNCKSIESVEIGSSVNKISNNAFYGCEGLKRVSIGENVNNIEKNSFGLCGNIESVVWNSRNHKEFDSSENPFNYKPESIISFVIGEGVEYLPSYLCYNMKSLKEIKIPASVESMGNGVFSKCSGLQKVNYMGSVDTWAKFEFIYIGYNPTYYAKDLYINGELLTNLEIKSADYINKYAFNNLKSLKSIKIPETVSELDIDAFNGCENITSVHWGIIKHNDFSDKYKTPFYKVKDKITSFTFGENVEHIPAYLCREMKNVKNITLPESLRSVGKEVFDGCEGLVKLNYLGNLDEWVDIDFATPQSNPTYYTKDIHVKDKLVDNVKIESAKIIKDYVFYNCEYINSVELGSRVSYIVNEAFSGCNSVKKCIIKAIEPPTSYWRLFPKMNQVTLYVPCESLEDYKERSLYKDSKEILCIDYTDIIEVESSTISVENGLISSEDIDFRIFNTAGQDVTSQNGNLSSGVYIVATDKTATKVMMQ